jgi:hypothetical protein
MLENIKETAELFRLGHHTRANDKFVSVIDDLMALQQKQTIPIPGLLGLLNQILGAQQRGDHIQIADLLEHEVLPLLKTHLSDDENG